MLRRHPTLFILASTQFGGAMAWASFITFFPTFALDKHGLSLVQIGVIFSAFPIGATIGSLTVGLLSNMARRRKPFIFLPGFVMPVLYVTIMSLGPDSPALIVAAVQYFVVRLLGAGAVAVPDHAGNHDSVRRANSPDGSLRHATDAARGGGGSWACADDHTARFGDWADLERGIDGVHRLAGDGAVYRLAGLDFGGVDRALFAGDSPDEAWSGDDGLIVAQRDLAGAAVVGHGEIAEKIAAEDRGVGLTSGTKVGSCKFSMNDRV